MIVDFHGVYQRYSQDVYRFAYFLCENNAWAEDIAQETFVRAWITPGTIRVGTVKAYLFMIARNLYRAELKRKARHVALDEALPDLKANPQLMVDVRLELEEVLRSLQTLPEIDRATLLMHVHEKMPHAEIAAALGLTVDAVKVKIHRARVKLNQLQLKTRGRI